MSQWRQESVWNHKISKSRAGVTGSTSMRSAVSEQLRSGPLLGGSGPRAQVGLVATGYHAELGSCWSTRGGQNMVPNWIILPQAVPVDRRRPPWPLRGVAPSIESIAGQGLSNAGGGARAPIGREFIPLWGALFTTLQHEAEKARWRFKARVPQEGEGSKVREGSACRGRRAVMSRAREVADASLVARSRGARRAVTSHDEGDAALSEFQGRRAAARGRVVVAARPVCRGHWRPIESFGHRARAASMASMTDARRARAPLRTGRRGVRAAGAAARGAVDGPFWLSPGPLEAGQEAATTVQFETAGEAALDGRLGARGTPRRASRLPRSTEKCPPGQARRQRSKVRGAKAQEAAPMRCRTGAAACRQAFYRRQAALHGGKMPPPAASRRGSSRCLQVVVTLAGAARSGFWDNGSLEAGLGESASLSPTRSSRPLLER